MSIDVYTTVYEGSESDAQKQTDEEICWCDTPNLPSHTLSNVPWLIGICREKLTNPSLDNFEVIYSA